jgi:Zn-dependent protease with chaperone function
LPRRSLVGTVHDYVDPAPEDGGSKPVWPLRNDVAPELVTEGSPPELVDRRSWIAVGVRRQPWGALGALLATWTGLLLMLWAATLGLVLSVLVVTKVIGATGFTNSFFSDDTHRPLSVTRVMVDALGGAAGGFSASAARIFSAETGYGLGALCLGVLAAIVIVLLLGVFEGDLLLLRRCRRPSLDELRRISPSLQRISEASGLEHTARLAVLDIDVPSAWTHCRHVVVSTGLLDTLDEDELTAVLAQRMHSWQMGDAMGRSVVWACAWPIAMLYNLAASIAGYRLDSRQRDRARRPSAVGLLAWMTVWPTWVLVRLVLVPVLAGRLERYAYEADEATKHLGFAPGLISALRKGAGLERGRNGWEAALCSVLPPAPLRIEKLQSARPLSAFFRAPELGRIAPARNGWRLVPTVGAAVLLTLVVLVGTLVGGAVPAVARNSPQESGATFVASYLDAALSRPAYRRLIAEDGASASVSTMESAADASPLGVAAVLAAGHPTVSRASVVACRSAGATTPVASVTVLVRWNTAISGASFQRWLTASLRMVHVADGWRPITIPTTATVPRPTGDQYRGAAGFRPCAVGV